MAVEKINGDKFTIFYNNLSREDNISIFICSKGSNNYDNLVKNNQCYIVVNDFNKDNIKDIFQNAIVALKTNGYNKISQNIVVLVRNEAELNMVNNITFGDYYRAKVDELGKKEEKKETNISDKDKEFVDRLMKFNTVNKIDNGIMKQYIQRKTDSNNIGYMLEDVNKNDIYDKYLEILNDSSLSNDIASLSEEELGNYVLDAYADEYNAKKYYMESALDQVATDKKGALAGRVAYKNEGLVNKEIGVVENGPDNSNHFNTVEENDDHVNVVTPQVNFSNMSSNGSSNNSFGGGSSADGSDYSNSDYSDGYLDSEEKGDEYVNENGLTEEEVQSRQMEQTHVKKRVLKPPTNYSSGLISITYTIVLFLGLMFYLALLIFILA